MTRSILLVVTIALVLTPLTALAIPGIPHQFYGDVTFGSGSTPDGLLVQAKVDGMVVGTSQTKNGRYGVTPYLLKASKSDGEWSGEEVRFFVAGIDTGQTDFLVKGGYTQLNLTVSGSVGTISKSETDTISDETVVVTPSQPLVVTLGNALTLNLTATSETSAVIEQVEQLPTNFFSGSSAPPTNTQILNGYEIKISGSGVNISVTMSYDATGIDVSTIQPYRFDGTGWVAVTPFTVNTVAKTVTFSIATAQTPYALFGSAEPEPEPEPEPDPGPGSNPTPGGEGAGGGGGDEATIPPPAGTSATGDITGDGRVGILDFNALMIAWGQTGTGISADLNGDGRVDIFDFNVLMVNWVG